MRQHVDDMEQVTLGAGDTRGTAELRATPDAQLFTQRPGNDELVSDYLLLSKRSLQRLLAEEGTSFQLGNPIYDKNAFAQLTFRYQIRQVSPVPVRLRRKR